MSTSELMGVMDHSRILQRLFSLLWPKLGFDVPKRLPSSRPGNDYAIISCMGSGVGVKRSSTLPQEMARYGGGTRATPVMWAVGYGIQRTGASCPGPQAPERPGFQGSIESTPSLLQDCQPQSSRRGWVVSALFSRKAIELAKKIVLSEMHGQHGQERTVWTASYLQVCNGPKEERCLIATLRSMEGSARCMSFIFHAGKPHEKLDTTGGIMDTQGNLPGLLVLKC
ncbi:hypothetical protein B0T20DRAFT_395495 [Sordaria brevicollis]|uniref:Uncharacterized protein n=1 Tax=Sordaria brevicollis TaxID=83679 RepID=A0AAE0U9K3_SORBR|nr:hypothetical protein B0T20DRAFT_395495 [Sordaria brevicollis]